MAGNITDVTDNNFQAEVLENDTPVLVDFWAPWCGPCRLVAPAMEEIAEARDDIRIVKLNMDDNQQTAVQYQVLAIPTMILFRNGQEAKRDPGRDAQEAHRGRARSPRSRPSRVAAPPGRFPAVSEPLAIHLCGELRVELAGERREAQLRGRQGRLAFAYLVLHRDRAGPPRRADRGAVGARGRPAARHRARAGALAPAPRGRAGRRSRAATRCGSSSPSRSGSTSRRSGTSSPRGGLDANAAQVAAELAEPGLLPDLDAPWLSGPARRPRGAADRGAGDWSPGGCARRRRTPAAERAARAAIAARAVPRVAARGADRGADRSAGTSPRRCAPTTRSACCCARSSGRRRARAGRAARAAARARRRSRPPRKPAGLLERDAELAADRRRAAAGCARARAACWRSRGRPGSARRACSASCASGPWTAGAEVLDARAGRARARVRLRRRAPALRGGRRRASRRPPRRAPCSARARRADGLFAVLERAVPVHGDARGARPLVLCIDDLQWSDTSSLRFVAYLARRVAALPVLVATTIRTGEPDSDELLLGEIGQDPATVAVQPRPLTEDGTAGHGLRPARRRPTRRSPPPARRSPPATRCCCASC